MEFSGQVSTVHIRLDEDRADSGLDVGELTHFLYLFRLIYMAGMRIHEEIDLRAALTPTDALREQLRARIRSVLPDVIRDHFRTAPKEIDDALWVPLGDLEDLFQDAGKYPKLVFTRIKKESPMELWVNGPIEGLVIYALFAGGKFKNSLFEIELPSLAKTILAMRIALGPLPGLARDESPKDSEKPKKPSGPTPGP